LDEENIKSFAAARLGHLRSSMEATGRLREARFLAYFETNITKDQPKALAILENLIALLLDSKWDVERALTWVDIGSLQLNSSQQTVIAQAEFSLFEAENLFQRVSHVHGSIDISLIRLSGNKEISAGQKFLQKTEIANEYFKAGSLQNGIRTLAFSLSPELSMAEYSEEAEKAISLLEDKVTEAGSEILKQISMMHAIGVASLKAPEYGFALRSLESYYANLPKEIGPKYQTSIAQMLSSIYATFGKYTQALEVAEEGYNICIRSSSYVDRSDAAFYVGIRQYGVSQSLPADSAESIRYLDSALQTHKVWVETDREHGYVNGETQKCLQIADLESERSVRCEGYIPKPSERFWIERAKVGVSDSASILERNDIVDLEIKILMRGMKNSESLNVSLLYLEDLLKVDSVPPFIQAQAYLRTSIQGYALAMETLRQATVSSQESLKYCVNLLSSSLQASYKALTLYRAARGSEMVISCTMAVWNVLSVFKASSNPDQQRRLLTAFMKELRETEKVCDDMRRSIVPISSLDSLMSKRLLVSKQASVQLYNLGAALALHLGDASNSWIWSQSGKARAFADSLGAKMLIPEELLAKINEDMTARDMLREEKGLIDLLNIPTLNHVIIARKLTKLRKAMAENALLASIIRIQTGILAFETQSLEMRHSLSKMNIPLHSVKYVDWLIPFSRNLELAEIVLLVTGLDGNTEAATVSITVKEVKEWLAAAFTFSDMADPPLSKKTGNRLLWKMEGLVEGLSRLTKEDDLLILSPTGPLNRVPLHGLRVDGIPLIERNLLVYASNTATLNQCLLRSSESSRRPYSQNSTDRSADLGRVAIFGVYEDPTQKSERDLIFEHLSGLATKLDAMISVGPEVTKNSFRDRCSHSSWVHYHGHARYGVDDALKSSLVLSDGVDLFCNAQPEHQADDEEHEGLGRSEFDIPEILSMGLRAGAVHFTIIACDSGMQDIAPGDEPLGIVPALLLAGATSVVGCQWPIQSSAGRVFSEGFYQQLESQCIGGPFGSKVDVINISQALRTTVKKMRAGELGGRFKQAYYWAPFVLHGLWFFQPTD
jgi:CHAT domain-containing protein